MKHLVEAHSGTVAARSAGEGQGATFTVQLPIVAAYADESEPAAQCSAKQPPDIGRAFEGVTVLVADDDPESRELVTVLFEGAGASVFSSGSAPEALGVLQREHVDILLADIAMPSPRRWFASYYRGVPIKSTKRRAVTRLVTQPARKVRLDGV